MYRAFLLVLFLRPIASTAYSCDWQHDFIRGAHYSQISLTDHNLNPVYGEPRTADRAVAYCEEECDSHGGHCIGFWFQGNEQGFQSCGFYDTKNQDLFHKERRKDHAFGAICCKKDCPPAPPPPPPSGDTCLGGWPRFTSHAELDSDPWGNYFRKLYGSVPPFSYPLCIGDFWHFYDNLISSTGAKAPHIVGNCPTKSAPEGQRYVENSAYQPAGVSYAWHGPPYAAVEKHTWVEVSHRADPFGDEHFGLWLLYAKGNGIWFNTGKTKVFEEHEDAYHHFGVNHGNVNEELSKAAAHAGFDSVQFTKHHDHVNYPCDTTVDAPYMSLEIVAVKLTGTYTCGDKAGAPSGIIKAGWQGSDICHCDTSKDTLNCGNLATHAEVV